MLAKVKEEKRRPVTKRYTRVTTVNRTDMPFLPCAPWLIFSEHLLAETNLDLSTKIPQGMHDYGKHHCTKRQSEEDSVKMSQDTLISC